MTDPSDLLQEDLREFLDAEKACPDPAQEVQDRVYLRLSGSLALSGGLGDVPSTPPSGRPALSSTPAHGSFVARIVARAARGGLATFLVGAAVGATVYGTAEHMRKSPELPATPAVTIARPAPQSPQVVPDLSPPPNPAKLPAPVSPSSSRDRARGAEEQVVLDAKDRGLAAERKLVEMARTALARGQTDGALAAIHRHARQFPTGQLAEERDSLLVQALVAKGEFAQARAQATHFHRQHPRSLFSPVVDQALQSIP
jgi:hypothetical protein